MQTKFMTLAVATLILSAPLFAQQTQPNQPDPSVNQRRENQQDRIANGIDSGQLSASETENLESREANLSREICDDRSADGGKLTRQQRQQINHRQNNLSRQIYRQKHHGK